MKIVIVTGMSGAGKSTALNMLEDEGYLRSWQTVRNRITDIII